MVTRQTSPPQCIQPALRLPQRLRGRTAPLGAASCRDLPRLALHAAGDGLRRARSGGWPPRMDAPGRALGGLLRPGAGEAAARAGGAGLHLGHRGGELLPRRRRGASQPRAAAGADRRPPARAARQRRPADHRPDAALRRFRQVVRRCRAARGEPTMPCATCARSPAALSPPRAACRRVPSISTSPSASHWCP